VLSYRIVF